MTLENAARQVLEDAQREEWLTVKEFAGRVKMAEGTIRAWIRDGRAVGTYRDGQWLILVRRTAAGDPKAFAPKRVLHHQGVYFVECQEFIKIGYAEDVITRGRFINQASPFPCRAIGFLPAPDSDSAKALEAEWHRRFWALHERHEWFRAVPRLRDAITLEARPWPRRNTKPAAPRKGRYQ